MSGLTSLLYIGASGLSASQNGVQTASDNVANVDTPGFRRREAVQSTRPTYSIGGFSQGAGVEVQGTKRIVDDVLDRRVQRAGSEAGFSEARAGLLQQSEAIFADLEGYGISGAVDGLFGAFDQLATEPQDAGARQRVLEAADQLSQTVSFVASELTSQQLELDRRLEENVDRINDLSASIAQLNLLIGPQSDPPADLLDKRGAAITELSSLVGVNVVESDQRVSVSLKGSGFGLVTDGVTRPLTASVQAGVAVISGERSGLTEDLTDSLAGGSLTGTVEVRNVDLQASLDSVDQFAFDFANAINAVHAAGYGTDAVNGRNLFSVSATADGAGLSLAVDAAVDGQPDRIAAATDPLLVPGDNRNALAMAQLRNATLAGGETPGATVRAILSDFGTRLSTATTSLEAHTASKVYLEELQANLSGVSLDEEMTRLIQYQQSYSAAARIIRTADELMQEVVALKR